jgi:hypothetical protein
MAPAVISADSPRFLGFIPAAPTKASLLFDMLISCASIQGISWLEAAGAIHAENLVLRLIADRAGMPPTAGGCFVSGGSAGNLSALVVAREVAKRKAGTGAVSGSGGRWRVIVSADAHSSIVNTLRILEMDPLTVRADDHRMTGAGLRAAIRADGDPGSLAAVVATSGTTNAGIVDDLAGAAAVARDHGLWFHVDGAYGGAGLFAPSIRPRYDGIEHADSFVVDPHKWLFAPFDCAALAGLGGDPADGADALARRWPRALTRDAAAGRQDGEPEHGDDDDKGGGDGNADDRPQARLLRGIDGALVVARAHLGGNLGRVDDRGDAGRQEAEDRHENRRDHVGLDRLRRRPQPACLLVRQRTLVSPAVLRLGQGEWLLVAARRLLPVRRGVLHVGHR